MLPSDGIVSDDPEKELAAEVAVATNKSRINCILRLEEDTRSRVILGNDSMPLQLESAGGGRIVDADDVTG